MLTGMRLIFWLWCGWCLYWMLAALRSKATRRREPLASRLAHLLPLAVGATLLAWPARGWSALVWRLWPPSLFACWIGVALVIAGLAFAVWARVHLGGNWSGTVTIKQGHELIRSGPYAYVRHPIYTGLITALLGTAVASGTVRAAIGLAIIVASFVRKLRTEENFMRETFPGEYPRYSADVPALIPFTRPRRPGER
ncbi:MAG TPA: isoprenylcysteine carboxylmethyltransferase family protein [Steroidobacteraceae bacterium]|jgi:protein-S-isoprenylcysteine O-methyltransferase Ste14|nr:isoprenylcysteine carboxylmethyltransferase family protein [Steroidobacteraceae bacterium]